jgi:hypothetical protein
MPCGGRQRNASVTRAVLTSRGGPKTTHGVMRAGAARSPDAARAPAWSVASALQSPRRNIGTAQTAIESAWRSCPPHVCAPSSVCAHKCGRSEPLNGACKRTTFTKWSSAHALLFHTCAFALRRNHRNWPRSRVVSGDCNLDLTK